MSQGVPLSVSVAAIGLVAIGLFIGFVSGIIAEGHGRAVARTVQPIVGGS